MAGVAADLQVLLNGTFQASEVAPDYLRLALVCPPAQLQRHEGMLLNASHPLTSRVENPALGLLSLPPPPNLSQRLPLGPPRPPSLHSTLPARLFALQVPHTQLESSISTPRTRLPPPCPRMSPSSTPTPRGHAAQRFTFVGVKPCSGPFEPPPTPKLVPKTSSGPPTPPFPPLHAPCSTFCPSGSAHPTKI